VIAEGGTIHVPAPVISEAVTGSGPRDSRVNRALKSCVIMPLDESLARAAGALRYRHPAVGTIDAMVVACGDAVPGSIIITGDLADLRLLAAEQQRTVVIGF
jgi:hypothetical protein